MSCCASTAARLRRLKRRGNTAKEHEAGSASHEFVAGLKFEEVVKGPDGKVVVNGPSPPLRRPSVPFGQTSVKVFGDLVSTVASHVDNDLGFTVSAVEEWLKGCEQKHALDERAEEREYERAVAALLEGDLVRARPLPPRFVRFGVCC